MGHRSSIYYICRKVSSNFEVVDMQLRHMTEYCLAIVSKQGLLNNIKVTKLEFSVYCFYNMQQFRKAMHRIKARLGYIHTDVWVSHVLLKGED